MPSLAGKSIRAVLLLGFLVAGLLTARLEGAVQGPKIVKGTVKEIDIEIGTITLAGEGKMFNLAGKDIKVVSTSGHPGRLADVSPGAKVVLNREEGDVVSIQVEAASRWGILTAVDAKAHAIELRSGELDAPVLKVTVPADAKMTIEGKPGAFADLKAGQRIRVTLSLDGKSAVIVNAASTVAVVKTAEAYRSMPKRLSGILLDLDRDKRTVQLVVEMPSPLTLRRFDVEKDVVINLRHLMTVLERGVAFDDLAKLLKVHVQIDADTRTVTQIDAEYPTINRKVLDFDLDKGTVTIAEDKETKTLPLAKGARAFMAGEEVKWSQLPKGRLAMIAFSLDRGKVMALFVPKLDN